MIWNAPVAASPSRAPSVQSPANVEIGAPTTGMSPSAPSLLSRWSAAPLMVAANAQPTINVGQPTELIADYLRKGAHPGVRRNSGLLQVAP